MCRKALLYLTVAFVAAMLPAAAGDIVYFANGTTMPIESFTMEDGIIEVELEGGSVMAFPMEQIERIERFGEEVFNSATPNQMIETRDAPARPRKDNEVSGLWNRKYVKGVARPTESAPANPHIVTDARTGVTGYRPFGTSEHSAKAAVTAAGHLGVLGAGDHNDPTNTTNVGATPFGRGGRIGARQAVGQKPALFPVTRKDAPQPDPPSGDASGSESR